MVNIVIEAVMSVILGGCSGTNPWRFRTEAGLVRWMRAVWNSCIAMHNACGSKVMGKESRYLQGRPLPVTLHRNVRVTQRKATRRLCHSLAGQSTDACDSQPMLGWLSRPVAYTRCQPCSLGRPKFYRSKGRLFQCGDEKRKQQKPNGLFEAQGCCITNPCRFQELQRYRGH